MLSSGISSRGQQPSELKIGSIVFAVHVACQVKNRTNLSNHEACTQQWQK